MEYRTALEYGWSWDVRLTETVNVPGHVGEDGTFLRGRDDTLVVLRRMFNCLWLIHLSGLTIRGQFGARNFLISSRLSVRLRGVHLRRYTTDLEGNMDYEAFVASVRDMFLLEVIPADIARWLQLIGMGVRGDQGYLLRYYIALMEPPQQLETLFRSPGAWVKVSDSEIIDFIWRSYGGSIDTSTGTCQNAFYGPLKSMWTHLGLLHNTFRQSLEF